MKAITYERYGGPEVLQTSEVPKPIPKANEVLIQTKAVSINPYDWHYMRGEPRFMRLGSGLFSPKVNILGNDMAGVIEAVGTKVTKFKPGDEVIASPKLRALAEYVAVDERRVTKKPYNASMAEAASLIIAGVTALVAVRSYAQAEAGQTVLINGASGGVGSFAVQIAHHDGAVVTGICSGKNAALVRSIGAKDVIDYTTQNLEDLNTSYDIVIDMVGNLTVADFRRLVKPKGKAIVVGYTGVRQIFSMMLRKRIGSRNLQVVQIDGAEEMPQIVELMESGAIKPVIHKTYGLSETAEAMDYLEQGHVPGKLVITI